MAEDYRTHAADFTVADRYKVRHILVRVPPLSWWLRDSVARAAFLLTAAYLVRDRDLRLRVYPALAPMLGFPLFMMLQPGHGGDGGMGWAFAGACCVVLAA